MYIILLNFAQNSMLKMSSIVLYFSICIISTEKLNVKVFLAEHTVATVTYCAMKMISLNMINNNSITFFKKN